MSILFDHEKETRVPMSADNNSHGTPKADRIMDQWLRHYLGQLYAPVVGDSISDELIKRLKAKLD